MTFLFIFEFTDNYKIIKHEKQFKKIKVKIDSTKTSSSRSGKSSATSTSTTFYFNKGSILTNQDRKGIILNHQSYEQEIYEYMTDHQDSLYIWNLDHKTSKFAYEDQKNINISEEIENNNRIKIYFVVYIFFLVLFLKVRNRI
ncbi:hypothetical protein DMB68_08800 [Flavobacterium hydrophilum]|uniref:Uncharacterized protein n=2 Tax=Flavobacterium hydrophilum TaxID=2211445 RepID=A0A2V4C866_9FLAO|nr:hypothetical protein DMB68_08800 [Flavobacterium hydrophilum]